MKKCDVMASLLDARCNVPSEVVTFVGTNLKDDDVNYINFDHNKDSILEACGVTINEVREFSRAINDYMESLPRNEQQKSKAIEFVYNSNNKRWILLSIIGCIKSIDA